MAQPDAIRFRHVERQQLRIDQELETGELSRAIDIFRHTFGAFENAVAGFGTTNTTTGFNNFVNGNLARLQVAIDPQGQTKPGAPIQLPVTAPSFSRSNRYHEWAVYANDAWRLRQNLTVNLGLRYEYYGVQHNARQELDSNFYLGSGGSLPEQIANGPDTGPHKS